jgi:glycosyltransferase involved in cell wall biosynthesis
MRIAVINWSSRRAGGVETYLGGIIPELLRAGHEVGFWHEVDLPLDREPITIPEGVPVWSAAKLGAGQALSELRRWRPDLIYAHGMLDPELEAATIEVAPSVFFAHSYYGTCISGAKTFKHPVVRPCSRRFGWQCLLQYYPRRCGGWSPLTMLKEYSRQSARLELLHGYKAIVTHSAHIKAELIQHGLAANSAYRFPYYVHGSDEELVRALAEDEGCATGAAKSLPVSGREETDGRGAGRESTRRLLFLGRMDLLKGGGVLLDALPRVLSSLRVPLHVTFAGDGPARHAWERQSARLQERESALRVEFTGWVDGVRIDELLGDCDLLVLPSLWPEPFGLVGPEAGLRGVPVAAFGVGGIPDWLVDGGNGRIAHGDPPTAEGLADAIVGCLRDPSTHAAMRREAARLAQRFNMRNHLAALLDVFDGVLQHEREIDTEHDRAFAHPAGLVR